MEPAAPQAAALSHRLPLMLDRVAVPQLAEVDARQQLLMDMPAAEFIGWATWVNVAATSEIPRQNRGLTPESMCLVDGATAGGSDGPITYIAPDIILRDELLRFSWAGAQRLSDRLPTAGRLLATTIFLVQPFFDGNKRTARVVDLLARNGYDGSEQARLSVGRAIADKEAQANIDFAGLGESLAGMFSDYMTERYVEQPGTFVEDVEEAPAFSGAPGLGDDERWAMIDLLNEPFFGRPLILAWARTSGRDIGAFINDKGMLSAARVLRSLTLDDYAALVWHNDNHKQQFIETIVRAFADDEREVYGDIMRLTDGFWPPRTS